MRCFSFARAVCVAAVFAACSATVISIQAATDTWTGAGGGNWTDPTDWGGTAPVANDILQFDTNNNTTPNNDFTANTQFNGITFLPTAGAFTLNGNNVLLGGDINDNNTANPQTINLGLVLNGATSNINVASGGSLTLGMMQFGTAPRSNTTSTLNINNTVTATSSNFTSTAPTLLVQTDTPNIGQTVVTNTINIATGATFNVSNTSGIINSTVVIVGTPPTNGVVPVTNLKVSGGGTWNVSSAGSNFFVGVGSGQNSLSAFNATLDMSGLANFVLNDTSTTLGDFDVGYGTRPTATANLANTSNNITVNRIVVGNSGQTPGIPGGTNDNANGTAVSFLNLGTGTNVINVNTILVGADKASGQIQFQSSTLGSVVINGEGGPTTTTNITISDPTAGSGTGTSKLLLAGHNATVNGGTVIIGAAGNSTGSSTGICTFDTGTFNAVTLQLAVRNAAAAAAVGTFTLGGDTPNTTATGVLNVTTELDLANVTNATSSGTGTFTINGGTANIGAPGSPANIVDISTAGTHTTTINLNAGTLNMNGGFIGTSSAPITNVNLLTGGGSATLSNLGGTGITTSTNTAGGLLMNGAGTLTLSGVNSYTGGTTVSKGTLSVTGSITDTATVVVNTNGTLSGAGDGTTTGLISGPVSVNGGTLHAGLTVGDTVKLSMTGLTIHSGTVGVNLGSSFSSSLLNDLGNLTLGDTPSSVLTLNLSGTPAAGNYDIINYTGALTKNADFTIQGPVGFNYSLNYATIGEVLLHVTVANNFLTWTGAADGTSWDFTHANFTSGSGNVAYTNPTPVVFNDTSPANATTINISTTVSPSAVSVNSSTNNYTFTGSGAIGGSATLSKDGTSTLTILNNNTYSGTTTISNGTIQVGNGGTTGSLGTGTIADNATLAYNRSGTVTVGNTITGSGALTQMGPGTLILTGANSYGATTISAGTLQLDNGGTTGSLGAGAVVNNGTLAFDRSDPVYVFANNLSGTGGITSMAANTLQLTGSNTFSGPVNVLAGSTLQVTANSSLGATTGTVGNVTIAGGATLDLGGNTAANTLNFGTRVFHIQGTGVAGSFGALENTAVGTQQNSVFNYITLDGDATVGGGRMDIGRSVTNGSLNLNGHTLTVAMAATTNPIFSILDHVTVSPGNIVVASPPSGQLSGLDIEFGAQVGAGVNITFQPGSYGEFFQNTAGAVTAPLTFQGGNIFGAGTAVQAQVDSNIRLNGNVTIEPMSNGVPNATLNQPFLLTGNITDNGGGFGITKLGLGTVTLSGTNSYSGPTTVNTGTLQLGAQGSAPHTSSLVLGGGTFATGGFNQTMNKLILTSNSNIDMGSTPNILHFSSNSGLPNWNGSILTINNWVGNSTDPSLGGGPDEIFVGTNSYSGLSRAQLNSIQFPSEPQGAILLSDGELVPNVSGNPLTVPVLGDWNGDGVTSVADVSAAMTALSNLNTYEANKMLSDGDVVALGDFNGDGVVTNADVQGLISFLANGNGGGTLQAVPEPTSIMLWIAGTMTLAFIGRRKVNTSIVRREIS